MEVYLVGGAVRDEILGIKSYDKDYLVIGATPKQMLEAGFEAVGKDFPVFLHPQTKCEYALARTERKVGKGYKGFVFYSDQNITIEQDLCRRDFTINSLAKSKDGEIIDFYGGLQDLQNKILRHTSEAFIEDPLRVLRMARFYAKFYYLGFKVAPETLQLAKQIVESGEIQALTKERVWQETFKALNTKNPSKYFEILQQIGCLQILMPNLSEYYLSKNLQKGNGAYGEFLNLETQKGNGAYNEFLNLEKQKVNGAYGEFSDDFSLNSEKQNHSSENLTNNPANPTNNFSPELLFAKIFAPLELQNLTKDIESLKAPKAFLKYAQVAHFVLNFKNTDDFSSSAILELCKKTDFWRKSDLVLEVVEIYHLTNLTQILKKLKELDLSSITQNPHNQNLDGKLMAQAIFEFRQEALKQILKSNSN